MAPPQGDDEHRTREIQERIRRQIAERRGGQSPAATPPQAREVQPPPLARAETTQLPEPFGGPLGRMLEELQKRAQPQPEPATPPPVISVRANTAELERQAQLAGELRALEISRSDAKRRAAHLAE